MLAMHELDDPLREILKLTANMISRGSIVHSGHYYSRYTREAQAAEKLIQEINLKGTCASEPDPDVKHT